MATKGHSPHTKRISLGRNLRISSRKAVVWLATSKPGPHPKASSMPVSMLLRDELGLCTDLREAKRILMAGGLLIDGSAIKDHRRPIGLLDIVQIPQAKKAYRMQISGGQLRAKEISQAQANVKYCKVVGKRTEAKGKLAVALHDGRTLIADNNVKVGSTLRMSVPQFKLESQIPLAEGAKCYVVKGKHAGTFAVLKKITQSAGSMPSRATLESKDGELITLANYIIAVDDEFDK